MVRGYLTYNDSDTYFNMKVRHLTTTGAFLICLSAFLATQNFIMKIWPSILVAGVVLILSALLFSIVRKVSKRAGIISADKKKKKKRFDFFSFINMG